MKIKKWITKNKKDIFEQTVINYLPRFTILVRENSILYEIHHEFH